MSFVLASQTTTKENAGNASIGYQVQTTATLAFPRLVILVEDLPADVNCSTSILTRYDVTNNCYIELVVMVCADIARIYGWRKCMLNLWQLAGNPIMQTDLTGQAIKCLGAIPSKNIM